MDNLLSSLKVINLGSHGYDLSMSIKKRTGVSNWLVLVNPSSEKRLTFFSESFLKDSSVSELPLGEMGGT